MQIATGSAQQPITPHEPTPHPPGPHTQVTLVTCLSVLLAAFAAWVMNSSRSVYLLDFSVYKPPDRCVGVWVCVGGLDFGWEAVQGP